MKRFTTIVKNLLLTLGILSICFLVCMIDESFSKTNSLIPSVFILGSFLVSVLTEGYIYGVIAALVSVLAVNFAFTYPFYALNFSLPENLLSATIMIIVTLITCGLTTKLKRQEYLRAEGEKERMRANLLRAISHDLRTPLTTIYGVSSALLDNQRDFSKEQTEKMLYGIKEDSEWLIRMVENLLSVTRLDGGHMDIIKKPTVLDELIDSVLVKFSNRYPEQEVSVDIPETFLTVPMDAILIEQVIVNMLENAVHHARGMTELSLRVSLKGKKVLFEVEDNGCGIEKEQLKSVFSGYFTAEKTPSDGRQKNNIGIGLSVCATIIKAHGGEIGVESTVGKGSRFYFSLNPEEEDAK